MGLTLTNVLINGLYYSVTVVALPAALLLAERSLGLESRPGLGLRVAGAASIVAGATLQAWCILLFQRIGGGTPSPAVPTRRLVTSGPYRWVRNPMNTGELLVFLGLAACFGSVALLAYTLAAWLCFHVFIVAYEEPRNAQAFGDAFAEYRAVVRRWLPRRPRGAAGDRL